MRLYHFSVLVALFAVTPWGFGCGSSDSATPGESNPFGSGDGGAVQGPSQQACNDYCTALVTKADGCEHYNDKHRCEDICGFYAKSACEVEWEAYTACMTADVKAACITPSDGGKIALDVQGCASTFTTWHDCREAKHASPCPY